MGAVEWGGAAGQPSDFRIPSSRHIRPFLNREILIVAQLKLRFRSVVATQSDAILGAKTGSYFFADPKTR